VPVDEDGNTLPANTIGDVDTVSEAKPVNAIDSVLSSDELEALVGPIALYPDDLLAIVLPASTYPLEIVQAARFLERLESDSTLEPDDEWDDSVVALLNYPEVVRMMDEDIDWTWSLGEAVISQQSEVIAAVEAFRDRAYAAGNLKTDENQTVTYDQGGISIEPADEEIIYVPYYEPEEVVVYQPRRVYHYYPDPYPVYYYPYPVGYSFRSGYFWGVTTAFSIGWHNHYLSVYHPTYWGHPYYGRNYYGHYYRYPSVSVYNSYYVNNSYRTSSSYYRNGDYWRPRTRAGSRQDEPRVRNYHYPPGGDQRRRSDNTSRNQLSNRDNGRLNLNMRERSVADRSRTIINSDGRATLASNGNRQSTSTSRARTDATTSRQGNRTASNNNASPRVNGGGNQERVAAGNTRSGQNGVRTNGSRSDIQFRDRGDSNRATSSRNTMSQARPSTELRQSTDRNASSFRSDRSQATQQRSSPTARATAPRSSATPTFRQRTPSVSTAPRSTAPRSSVPSVRQSAPRASAPRASAPSVRQSAPRSPAPRVSAPSVRQSAPAPRSSAPRAAAPRSSAPRASAPSSSSRSSAPSSGSRSSGSRSSSRSSSSSRSRSRSN
jgi:hypothetical protein